MLYREIIAVCSEIHTKHINTLCGQNVELLNAKLVVHIVTTGLVAVAYPLLFSLQNATVCRSLCRLLPSAQPPRCRLTESSDAEQAAAFLQRYRKRR